jgi:MinD-like ATPase involved in chromosome partitioning or flagellar assembly
MARGKIITFYSYKGGARRTMALANVAWILASNGPKVLMADWDLDSPVCTSTSTPSSTVRGSPSRPASSS